MTRNIVVLFSILFILSCEKDKSDNIFTGITNTTNVGDIISSDDTDWNFNDSWNAKEASLFDLSYEQSCISDVADYSIIAFPNPCQNIVNIYFDLPMDNFISMRLVDENYKVLLSLDSLTSGVAINLNSLAIENQMIRAYYKVYGLECELKGHGDIKIN